MVGDSIGGRYDVIRLLGEGGMGAVYEARHRATGGRVAVKVITGHAADDEQRLARFQVEAKAASVIESDHIARVLDLDTDAESGLPFMAMEYLDGEDLQQLLERLGKLPISLALRIMAQACRGLSRAHAARVLHRDIKPANIFVAVRDGASRVVKLLDFGIAKIRKDLNADGSESGQLEGGITTTGTMIGSPLYMSPEQTRSLKKVDARSDVWSLGMCFHEAVCGFSPYAAAEGIGGLILDINTKVVRVREAAPWVPPEVAAIIERALRIDVDARWQTIDDMLAAIEALLPGGVEILEETLVGDPSTTPWGATDEGDEPPTQRYPSGPAPAGVTTEAMRTTPAALKALGNTTHEPVTSSRPPSAPPTAKTGPRPRRSWWWAGAAASVVGLAALGVAGVVATPSAAVGPDDERASQPLRNAAQGTELGQAAATPPDRSDEATEEEAEKEAEKEVPPAAEASVAPEQASATASAPAPRVRPPSPVPTVTAAPPAASTPSAPPPAPGDTKDLLREL